MEKKKRNRYKNPNVKAYLLRLSTELYAELVSVGDLKGIAVNKMINTACYEYLKNDAK